MSISISELNGIDPEIVLSLRAIGIDDATQLLAATSRPTERKELAAVLNLNAQEVLKLANQADLARVRGLNCVYVDLLLYAGVDRVAELRRRIPENLYVKMVACAREHHIAPYPRLEDVQLWVSEAKRLEQAIYY